ncbi:hypothetical protein BB560_004040 [Smittium megazygosporum]|uniref:Poly(A) RNA polymerase mitochondrial-like central palm domain-containing protein n=1 Tax=Smittium megazygosporum TaxID=133381 RepID=A0A2T9ZAA0_9FUNG|nr:hypothetical protein BB560_004040 [Smittium megazygosporum]
MIPPKTAYFPSPLQTRLQQLGKARLIAKEKYPNFNDFYNNLRFEKNPKTGTSNKIWANNVNFYLKDLAISTEAKKRPSFNLIFNYFVHRDGIIRFFNALLNKQPNGGLCENRITPIPGSEPIRYTRSKFECTECSGKCNSNAVKYLSYSFFVEKLERHDSSHFFPNKGDYLLAERLAEFDPSISLIRYIKREPSDPNQKTLNEVYYISFLDTEAYNPLPLSLSRHNYFDSYLPQSILETYDKYLKSRYYKLRRKDAENFSASIFSGLKPDFSGYGDIVFDIKRAFTKVLPKSFKPIILAVGSRTTMLATKESDLDVTAFALKKGVLIKDFRPYMGKISRLLFSKKYMATPINAKVPIIKLSVLSKRFDIKNVDISFNGVDSIMKSLMIKNYSSIDPRVKSLILWVKFWALKRKIADGVQMINTYSLTIMLLSYLSHVKVIPPFKEFVLSLDNFVQGLIEKSIPEEKFAEVKDSVEKILDELEFIQRQNSKNVRRARHANSTKKISGPNTAESNSFENPNGQNTTDDDIILETDSEDLIEDDQNQFSAEANNDELDMLENYVNRNVGHDPSLKEENTIPEEYQHIVPSEEQTRNRSLNSLREFSKQAVAVLPTPEAIVFSRSNITYESTNNRTAAELLIDFLRYFGFYHDFYNHKIDLWNGTCDGQLIDSLQVIKKKGGYSEKIVLPMIPDPIDRGENKGRNLDLLKLDFVLSEMRRAYFILNLGYDFCNGDANVINNAIMKPLGPEAFNKEYLVNELGNTLSYTLDSDSTNSE